MSDFDVKMSHAHILFGKESQSCISGFLICSVSLTFCSVFLMHGIEQSSAQNTATSCSP